MSIEKEAIYFVVPIQSHNLVFMKKFLKHKSRLGDVESVKMRYRIEILSVNVPIDHSSFSDNCLVNVCFERGGKLSSTSDISYSSPSNAKSTEISTSDNAKSTEISINQMLELMVTLYKDRKSGKFQEKVGKLYIRKHSKKGILFSSDSYEGIGMACLKLESLVLPKQFADLKLNVPLGPVGRNSTKTLTDLLAIKKSSRGLSLKVAVSTEEVEIDDNDDDNASVSSLVSDTSISSTVGASFDLEDGAHYDVSSGNISSRSLGGLGGTNTNSGPSGIGKSNSSAFREDINLFPADHIVDSRLDVQEATLKDAQQQVQYYLMR